MNNPLAFGVLVWITLSPIGAQGSVREVPPGREVRESKLLTLSATDRWDLEVAAGEVLLCQVTTTAFDPILELVTDDGKVLGHDDGEGTDSELWLRTERAGAVSFRVSGHEGRGGGQYQFFLQRFRTEDIELGQRFEHRFGREEWWHYHLELQAGDVIVPTAGGDGRVTAVFDMQRRHHGALLGGYLAPETGSYFVRVEGSHEHHVLFECTLARQRQGSASAVDEQIATDGLDLWRLNLRAGEAWSYHLEMPAGQLATDVRSPTPGDGVPFVWTGSLSKGGSHRRWLIARRECELEIRLHNRSGAAAGYRLRLEAPSTTLPHGEPVTATLPLGSGALYELTTTPGQLIRLRAQSTAFDAQLDLWDPDGNVLVQCDDPAPLVRDPDLTFLVRRPGTHRILLFSPGGCGGGEYSLSVESLAIPVLEFDRPLRLEVSERGLRHCHFDLQQGQQSWLSLRSADFDVAVTVLAPDGRELGTWEGGDIGTDALAAFAAPLGGRYTLLVHSRSGAGTCLVRAIAPVD